MTRSDTPTVKCPTCAATVPWSSEQPYRPFCSERCKLIDLGDWATEAHKIPGEPAVPLDELDDRSPFGPD